MFSRKTVSAVIIGFIICASNAIADPLPATDKDVDDLIKRMDKPNAEEIVADLKRHAAIEQFREGAVRFAIFHELGHFLVREYRIPVLGREEDAADSYAAFALAASTEWQQMVAPIMLWQATATNLSDVDWWDEHGTDQQRASRVACLLAGQDPERFGRLPELLGARAEKLAKCQVEAERNTNSWKAVLEGKDAVMIRRQKAKVTFDRPRDDQLAARTWLMNSKVLESVKIEVARYRLPDERVALQKKAQEAELSGEPSSRLEPAKLAAALNPHLEIRAKSCGGTINAFFEGDIPWTPPPALPVASNDDPYFGGHHDYPTLTVCYELVQWIDRVANQQFREQPSSR